VRAVIAKSIERIHTANLVNFGIAPLILKDEADYAKLRVEDELAITDIHQALGQRVIQVQNLTQNYEFEVSHSLSSRQTAIVLSGGLLNYARE